MMNIQLLTIEPTAEQGKFKLLVKIGNNFHEFTMTVASFSVNNQQIQVTTGDDIFSELFRFNQIVASDICKLVVKLYNNQIVEFPVEICEFYLGEIKVAS